MVKTNKKHSILQVTRLILQVVLFIALPSLYISTFSGVKQIYVSIIHQSFSSDLLPQLIEVIVIIPITIFLGRFFCGWMCTFGALSDFITRISDKVIKKKWKLSERTDAWMKYIKYAVLVGVIIAVWSFNVTLFNSASPWDAFGMLATVGKMPDLSFVITNLTIGFVILVGIIIASLFIERFFCRYLCPLGAIFAITSKLKITKIKKPSEHCGKCRICTNSCPMGIPLYKMDVVNSGECIDCMKCITACPRGNATFTVAKSDVCPLIAGVVTVGIITGTYYTATFAVNTTSDSSTTTSQTSKFEVENKLYNDGTYQGVGTGYRGLTTVSVTVKNDKITDISTVSTNDDDKFYNTAYSSVTKNIISSQSTDVDAVSGATYSSKGIMEAVANALEKAKIV